MEPLLKSLLKRHSPLLSIDFLSADIMNLADDLETLEELGQKLLHFDIMDGVFSQQITVGPHFISRIKTILFKDFHLMVEEPHEKLFECATAGADCITVQLESTGHSYKVLNEIRHLENRNDPSRGILAGVAVNPGTPLIVVEELFELTDLIYMQCGIQSFAGQTFLPEQKERFFKLKESIQKSGRSILVGIEGGISKKNLAEASSWGADIIVLGRPVFEQEKIRDNINEINRILYNANKYF